MKLTFRAPLKIESLNVYMRMHGLQRHRYDGNVSQKVRHLFWVESMMLYKMHPTRMLKEWGPVDVHLTRKGPRRLDNDNLVGGLKKVRDCIAECLGAPNDADDNGLISWSYGQEMAKDHGLEVEIAQRKEGAA